MRVTWLDTVIMRAIGTEIRRTRATLGWTRANLVERLTSDIHVQTVGGYEQGNRHCTVARLIELCKAMDVPAAELITNALQRAELELANAPVRVDLEAMLRRGKDDLGMLWLWAHHKSATATDDTGIAVVNHHSIPDMAACLGLSPIELRRKLVEFTPDLIRPTGDADGGAGKHK